MSGQRVLVSGMGSELGSLVASMLEAEPWVGALAGIDVDPPRRRLRRAEFHLLQPSQRDRIVDVVTTFDPHVLVHIAVWEPDARAGTSHARTFTSEATAAFLGAAAECPSLQHVVVRSGISVYGRARGAVTRPDEDTRINPTSTWGKMLAEVESSALDTAARVGVGVTTLRLAPVIGPHVPSPLGRLLRQPLVPFSALADAPFTVIEDADAARAIVAAARQQLGGTYNVVAPGAITTLQAILRGRRVPVPLIGPEWSLAARASQLLGAPIPDHVIEVMHRGRLADGRRLRTVLDAPAARPTSEVIDRLYNWETVVHVPPRRHLAAVASGSTRSAS